jgi:hypothetical protein
MVFTVTGVIGVSNLRFLASWTEKVSSTFSVTLVIFSITFPLCIAIVFYTYLIRKSKPFELMRDYGTLL